MVGEQKHRKSSHAPSSRAHRSSRATTALDPGVGGSGRATRRDRGAPSNSNNASSARATDSLTLDTDVPRVTTHISQTPFARDFIPRNYEFQQSPDMYRGNQFAQVASDGTDLDQMTNQFQSMQLAQNANAMQPLRRPSNATDFSLSPNAQRGWQAAARWADGELATPHSPVPEDDLDTVGDQGDQQNYAPITSAGDGDPSYLFDPVFQGGVLNSETENAFFGDDGSYLPDGAMQANAGDFASQSAVDQGSSIYAPPLYGPTRTQTRIAYQSADGSEIRQSIDQYSVHYQNAPTDGSQAEGSGPSRLGNQVSQAKKKRDKHSKAVPRGFIGSSVTITSGNQRSGAGQIYTNRGGPQYTEQSDW